MYLTYVDLACISLKYISRIEPLWLDNKDKYISGTLPFFKWSSCTGKSRILVEKDAALPRDQRIDPRFTPLAVRFVLRPIDSRIINAIARLLSIPFSEVYYEWFIFQLHVSDLECFPTYIVLQAWYIITGKREWMPNGPLQRVAPHLQLSYYRGHIPASWRKLPSHSHMTWGQ